MLKKTISQIASAQVGTAFREPSMTGYLAVVGKLSANASAGTVSNTAIANRLYASYPGADTDAKKAAVKKVFVANGTLIAWQPRTPGSKAYLFVVQPNGTNDVCVGGQLQTVDVPALLEVENTVPAAQGLVSLVPAASADESDTDVEIASDLELTGELLTLLLSQTDWVQGTVEEFEVLRKGQNRVW